MTRSVCLNCSTSEQERPLISLKFQEDEIYICPQCLPILIHKPYQLAEKIAGFTPSENTPADGH